MELYSHQNEIDRFILEKNHIFAMTQGKTKNFSLICQ